MKISIVTVSFNSSATIKDTIESVLAQSYLDIEHIIIDGGSTDDTVTIIKEYGDRIAKVISGPDRGIYDAMNKGVQAATGDIIGMLNSDDYFENDNVLTSVADAFMRMREIDIVFGNVVFVNPDDLTKVVRYYSSVHFKAWKLRFGWMPPHPATFVKKAVYQQSGLYSLRYRIAADYEMFVRLLLVRKLKFYRVDKVLVRMRMGGVSTANLKSRLQLNREIVMACKANGVYTNLLLVLCKLPFKLLELVRRPLG
jgi:glycosyltransferase involved in cell wall biosynthesis